MIVVRIRHRQGSFSLDIDFASTGKLTALLGPSGSGKSSVINMIAGLVRPDEGQISIGAHVFVDTLRGVFVPAHRRGIGYVFQDARLFPHLTVAQNLGYGRWFRRRAQGAMNLNQIVDMLGIGHLLQRRPTALSGGEKQRVAIGRALASNPTVLLMDEPLASLDDQRKAEILPFIERCRDELDIPIVFVSHSIPEVARLADEVVLLAKGKVSAAGPPRAVLTGSQAAALEDSEDPGSVLEMAIIEQDDGYGLTTLGSSAGTLRIAQLPGPVGQSVRVRIRARDVMLATERPRHISGLNILQGRIVSLRDHGSSNLDVAIDCGGQRVVSRITRLSRDALHLEVAMPVYAIVKTVSFQGAGAPVALRGGGS